MLLAITVTLLVAAALLHALGAERPGGLIVRRPYNNRYSDAAGAREEHLD